MRAVVAGNTRLYVSLAVSGFPMSYAHGRVPEWTKAAVSGTGPQVARVMRGLGSETVFCTAVGVDQTGDWIRGELRSQGLLGVGAIGMEESPVGVVQVAPDGVRMGQPGTGSLDQVHYPVDLYTRLARGADCAVLTSSGFTRDLLQPTKSLGIPVAIDLHMVGEHAETSKRAWAEVADVLICSSEGLNTTPEAWIATTFRQFPGCAIAVVGCGAEGCRLGLRDGRLVRAQAVAPRGVLSTDGAGDVLLGAFVHTWITSGNPVRALRNAVLYAGWSVGSADPLDTELSEAELTKLLGEHPVRIELDRWN